jgi:hypothetical protein
MVGASHIAATLTGTPLRSWAPDTTKPGQLVGLFCVVINGVSRLHAAQEPFVVVVFADPHPRQRIAFKETHYAIPIYAGRVNRSVTADALELKSRM